MYCVSLSVERFLSLSEDEQLQTIKELNDTGNVDSIIDVLTNVGIDNLSMPLFVYRKPPDSPGVQ